MVRAYLTRRRGGAEGGERSLNQIDKKVGTPRRRCPKHQAQRAVSEIQRRLQRERRTATARHPYQFLEIVCIEVIVSLQLDFAAQKKGCMAVPAVWRLVYFLAPCPLEPRSPPTHTGETRCVPLLKSKSKLQFRRRGFVFKCRKNTKNKRRNTRRPDYEGLQIEPIHSLVYSSTPAPAAQPDP